MRLKGLFTVTTTKCYTPPNTEISCNPGGYEQSLEMKKFLCTFLKKEAAALLTTTSIKLENVEGEMVGRDP